MFADYLDDDNYYIRAAEIFLSMPLETINDTLNSNCFTDVLDLNMVYLNKTLSSLNFLGPPENSTDHKYHCSLGR